MRLVKIRRRSTAHYQRRAPLDATWMTKPGSQDHLARLYNRQEQLDNKEVDWMRRTLGSVSLTDDEWRLRKTRVPPGGAAATSSMNEHQLRQLERDRQIRERRERRRRERLGGSELAGSSPSEQQQQQSTPVLAVKGKINAGTDGRSNNHGNSGGLPVAPQQALPLGRSKRLPQYPHSLPLMHPAALPPLLGQLHHPSDAAAAAAHSNDRRSPRQAAPIRQQLRRLGGHHQPRQQRTSLAEASADLQYLMIAGPATHKVRWPTPVGPLQSDGRAGGNHHYEAMFNTEPTLVPPRNPENSPEPTE